MEFSLQKYRPRANIKKTVASDIKQVLTHVVRLVELILRTGLL